MEECRWLLHLPLSPCSVKCLSTVAQAVGYTNTNQKPEQHRTMAKLLCGRNTFVSLLTGYGKSLIKFAPGKFFYILNGKCARMLNQQNLADFSVQLKLVYTCAWKTLLHVLFGTSARRRCSRLFPSDLALISAFFPPSTKLFKRTVAITNEHPRWWLHMVWNWW